MSEHRKLIIYGAGDFGREIIYTGKEQHPEYGIPWESVYFVDDAPEKIGTRLEGLDILSLEDVAQLPNVAEFWFISGIGNTALRKATLTKLRERLPEAKMATVVHRSAVVMPTAKIANGVYVGCNATIGIGCDIGENVIVNFNCSIGHDVRIDPYSVISPGCVLSGRTTVGESCFLGSGVVTYPSVTIGNNCSVSAGLEIARSLKENTSAISKPNIMLLPNT